MRLLDSAKERFGKKTVRFAWFGLWLCLSLAKTAVAAEAGNEASLPIAVFIRGDDLWIKSGETERQLTNGDYVRNPRFSPDGQWIAFTKGKEETDIWLYHLKDGKSHRVAQGADAQWSPEENQLAFLSGDMLSVADPARPEAPVNVIAGVGNYSWRPDGRGFVVSTKAELLPDGWTNVRLYDVPLDANLDPKRAKLLATLPQTESFFAIGTSRFEWSADGQWIVFIAVPTASLSADANTLCVISADGKRFVTADTVLNDEAWFAWAPKARTLAFIAGAGRDATSNKRLTLLKRPFPRKKTFTPAGFVDRDVIWIDDRTVTVSRLQKESIAGNEGKASLPVLVQIDIAGGGARTITSPPAGFGDFGPRYGPFSRKLIWIRSDRTKGSVWISGPDGSDAREWIPALTLPVPYYDRWNWSQVIDLHDAKPRRP